MNNQQNGKLIIVSGISGAGKGTICKELINRYPDLFKLSISVTTRKPRNGEEDGKDYFFIEHDDFERMKAKNEFLECAKYVDNCYGTPKKWVEDQLKKGFNVILEIEVQGALQVKAECPSSLMVFVVPPNEEENLRRFKMRGSESEEEIKKRLERAKEEMTFTDKYDLILVNVTVEKSVEMLYNFYKENI